MWLLTRLSLRTTIAASLLSLLALTSCGFELRGQNARAETLGLYPIAVLSAAPNSEFTSQLRTALSRLGASVVEPSEAILILQVGTERFEQRNLSLTARARAAELELRASVNFSLQLGEQWLIESETLTVVDQMLNDPLNVVGKTEELRLLQGELRATLVEALTRRIDYRLAADNADKT